MCGLCAYPLKSHEVILQSVCPSVIPLKSKAGSVAKWSLWNSSCNQMALCTFPKNADAMNVLLFSALIKASGIKVFSKSLLSVVFPTVENSL